MEARGGLLSGVRMGLQACPVLILFSAQVLAATVIQTSWGDVAEPELPKSIHVLLSADLPVVNASIDTLDADPRRSAPDTRRIQAALDSCPAGHSVKLIRGKNGASGFLSAPLHLTSGCTLWIDRGVTLFASRNPLDYDTGSGLCGTADFTHANACHPFIQAHGTVQSGIVGEGAIDGRGGSLLTAGPNAGKRSWWDLAYLTKSENRVQHNPRLLQVDNGRGFTLYRVSLLNSPNFHFVANGVSDLTAWGIKILAPSLAYSRPAYACPANSTPERTSPASCFTPDTIKNTDGFDPAQSRRVLLAHSYISVGDDHVAIKAHGSGSSQDLVFSHNHFYYGHGLSIGSETDTGVSRVSVFDLSIDGYDSPNGIGLRIKSDASRGGLVKQVDYRQICLRNITRPLVFDTFYSQHSGVRYPIFTAVRLEGVHDLGRSNGQDRLLTFVGHDPLHPLDIALNNVVFENGAPVFEPGHNGAPQATPAAVRFSLEGKVSFATSLVDNPATGVLIHRSAETGSVLPVDCRNAFVPLHSVLPFSPI
jgi:polygalacturonase